MHPRVLEVTERLIEREGRLLERRVWLQGLNTGRTALMLDYAQGGRGFETAWVSGGAYRTALSFYPGRASLRAVAVNGVEALDSCDAAALARDRGDLAGVFQRVDRALADAREDHVDRAQLGGGHEVGQGGLLRGERKKPEAQ